MFRISDNVIIKKMRVTLDEFNKMTMRKADLFSPEKDYWVGVRHEQNKENWLDLDNQASFSDFGDLHKVSEFYCMDIQFEVERKKEIFELFDEIAKSKNKFIPFMDSDLAALNGATTESLVFWCFYTIDIADIIYLQLIGSTYEL